jgi:Domain of unknown function (DUF4394)
MNGFRVNPARSRGLALALIAVAGVASSSQAELVYGVTQSGFLANWNSSTPGAINAGVAIQGLQANEKIVGLDFRPATGELYGVGSFSRLATQVGGGLGTPLNGTNFGFDFNPVVDRIRIVSDADQNLRVHPDTGAVVSSDGMLSYVMGDSAFGIDPNITHSAYTNSFAGATSTMLYGIDSALDTLVLQNPPNAGGLVTIGALGADITDVGGFDISGMSGVAYLAILNAQLSKSTFWTINLQTGQASMIGEIGGGSIITAMAVVPGPSVLATLGGLLALRRRRRS